MTEEQIERWAERQMDALDRTFLTTAMTQVDYEIRVRLIDGQAALLLRLATLLPSNPHRANTKG